ncbi:uncharacterized protein SPAPADRAFT_58120 [Spathaspora passalidarum NRRL Y-27907]|uniref:RRM domain-containing protein n=1 Tax=Spathaspora passalidarum (strain NRRL Y-27907 / 11-Y1) TaxID=619300 RepID=G3AFK9_SPAPN|nr:uncharacterized protein SPAPADRAFT_58120 [Spathaspora passalidarum NRRL Y-27907]EGW34998.1 hypothetical protein SPAPADRAFT_58120 [Spathaspora passalidarum NRRL Y-27907]
MNSIHKINQINQKELATNTSYKSSWHYDYRDTNYIYIGNIPSSLTAQDIVIIFSQYGIPTHLNLVKDKTTGEHRGFAFLKYAHFKSCILAIDNFNGIKVGDRNLRVDHNYYKLKGGELESDYLVDYSEIQGVKQQLENKDTKLIENKEADELKDPMEKYIDDDLRDPIENYKEAGNDDDELKDPMEAYLKRSDKHDKHGRHRNRHRSGHKDRERSPKR